MQTLMTKCRSLLVLLVSLAIPAAAAAEYAVVVNSENTYSASADKQKNVLKRLFLKRQKSWPNGIDAEPFNLKEDNPAYQALLESILEMDEAAVAAHWLAEKQTTGTTPPTSIASARVIMKLIGKKTGGVAIVSEADAQDLPETVKVLFTFSD